MTRMIYADEAIKRITAEYNKREAYTTGGLKLAWIEQAISGTPTVDAVPVRHGSWIPCSERLPAKTGHYLCSFKKPNRIDNIFVDLAYWTGGRWYGYLANEINAWMPLPDRYEEKAE